MSMSENHDLLPGLMHHGLQPNRDCPDIGTGLRNHEHADSRHRRRPQHDKNVEGKAQYYCQPHPTEIPVSPARRRMPSPSSPCKAASLLSDRDRWPSNRQTFYEKGCCQNHFTFAQSMFTSHLSEATSLRVQRISMCTEITL